MTRHHLTKRAASNSDDDIACEVPKARIATLIAYLSTTPWTGWLFVYVYVLFCFSAGRCMVLRKLIAMYTNSGDNTLATKIAALMLGFLEDFVCVTYLACALWLFDTSKLALKQRFSSGRDQHNYVKMELVATFVMSLLLFLSIMAPFAADLFLVASHEMRFTFDLIVVAISQKDFVSAAPISHDEVQQGGITAVTVVLVAGIFACVRAKASWADLTLWNPTHIATEPMCLRTFRCNDVKYMEVAMDEGVETGNGRGSQASREVSKENRVDHKIFYYHALRVIIVFVGIVAIPVAVVALRCACSPLVAYTGMNATLNEMFGHVLQPTPTAGTLKATESKRSWIDMYIHPTEEYELFGNNTLYRRTTGFRGDLAFDVDVSKDNPPNVLVIAIESFRFRDSHYLVGNDDPSNLFNGSNITITPNFDRWAKRGITLRNMWSSTPTSRSLESLVYAQIPYDSTIRTGITDGRKDTRLSGLPHLFKAKGYESVFTTGCTTLYDNWDVFLPTHGYDLVLDPKEMKQMANKSLGITLDQWDGYEKRGFGWGVHDDVSFHLVGDIFMEKAKEQKQRVASGKPEQPLFLTHYTISSHSPFEDRPTWYAQAAKPDFSALYKNEERAQRIQNYLEMRYFADMQLGKFMDRMEKEGILNDTIVIIVGDHGQAPEANIANTQEESVTRVAGTIIAEGRLGDAVGLVMEDAVEHYDILDTLADITGLPEGGFVQHGVGRSLKRKVPFGERVIFSNDPSRKMSIVRGHQRLRYDKVTPSMMLHDTEKDYHMSKDLFPGLTVKEQDEWKKWRDYGRRVAAYYLTRWDHNCLMSVNCP